jgi:hypothetical protein
MIRRFIAGTAMAAGLALSVTGCGAAGDPAGVTGKAIKLSAAQVLGKAADKTGQIDSFEASLSMRSTGVPDGDLSMTGSMQYRTKPSLAYRMAFDQMKMGAESIPGGMEMLLVDRTMYLKMPMLTQLQPSAKPWYKVSLDEVGRQSGLNVDDILKQSQQVDPVQSTRMLTASKDVREVGKETVDGVQTTHYTGTYRVADAIAQLPADQKEAVRKAFADFGQGDIPFDLWVDDQHLPRQMTMKPSLPTGGTMALTMKFRDFGKPVQITAPPASQVADLADLMAGGGAGGLPRS